MKPRQLLSELPVFLKTNKLTTLDCIRLARGFDFLSKTSDSDEDAVGLLFRKYPAMNSLNRRNPMLEELLLYTSVRLANDGRKYASVRLLGGALLSTFDTLTDLYMVYVYSSTGETGFANATLSSLLVNLSFQACVVLLQHKGHSRRKKLKELLYVLTFTKPGVDAYRVVIGVEHEVGSIMDPKMEMIAVKAIELFCEAIPGTLIQTYAFLTGSNQTKAAVFSLVVSIFTATFTSTGISLDKDLDRESRFSAPDFYGYFPSGTKKRAKVCMLIFLISACQLTAKSLAYALGAVESPTIVLAFMIVDVVAFLLYKLARRDFDYWVPYYGCTGVILSFIVRIFMKTIVDFTGNFQGRHPYELGGAYFAFTLLSTPVVCLYFGLRYISYMERNTGSDQISMELEANQVFGLIGGLVVLQLILLVAFFKSINPDYIRTFYSFDSEDVQSLLATSGRASTQAYDNYARVKRLPSSHMLATSLISIRGGESGRQQVFDADTIRRRAILAKASQELTAVTEAQ
ncbi:hypothetical protein TrVE_jg13484 [Triparma verrucosa]|uniref:Uncharacterized protein n=1 Tax=Triparma verrucosa TaxID=1606542 RepID=A0A9W7ENC0_9STRA|nr:hypothetical protein TrVE_jg13484 [Triparma verrucosa]